MKDKEFLYEIATNPATPEAHRSEAWELLMARVRAFVQPTGQEVLLLRTPSGDMCKATPEQAEHYRAVEERLKREASQ